jgi:hypothetical protein
MDVDVGVIVIDHYYPTVLRIRVDNIALLHLVSDFLNLIIGPRLGSHVGRLLLHVGVLLIFRLLHLNLI